MKATKRLIIILLINSYCSKGQSLMNGGNYYTDDGSLYWGATIAFSAINVTTSYFNIKKLHKYDKYRSNAIFGVISGGAQTALGLANLKAKYNNAFVPTSINIGVGLTTLVTSIVRLATKNPPKENNISLNFIYIPNKDKNNSLVGLTFKRQFK